MEKTARYNQLMRRRENQIQANEDLYASEDVAPVTAVVPEQRSEVTNESFHIKDTMPRTTDNATADNTQDTSVCVDISVDVEPQCNTVSAVSPDTSTAGHDKSVSTDIDSKSWQSFTQSLSAQQQIITMLRSELNSCKSPSARMEGDDKQTQFYTRLPSYAVFTSLLNLLLSVMSKDANHGLHPRDQFLLVLMKLRLALANDDLAYRFGITRNRVSQLFHEWVNVMSREFKQLIVWPDRQVIRETLPQCFKSHYPRATCIIDCSEVFIERATSLSARSETYSHYKSQNTAKFLVAISPTGAIIFVSKCWGGRASDKLITSKSGFLDHLMHGDLILADRGFDITEDLALQGSTLAIPPFTKGKKQLSQREVETARELSRVRIHVERAIGRIKHYRILQHRFPISLIKTNGETGFATIDKVLIVCAALSNLQPPLA